MKRLVFLKALWSFLNAISKYLKLDWDEWLIAISMIVAQKSKDPSSKVGSVIVTKDNRPVSFGFNGFVAKCDECYMTHERPLKYHLTVHGEMNAILFSKQNLLDCKIYSTHGPCDNCLLHLIQSGIKEIVYFTPSIMKDRGTKEQIKAISRLLRANPDVFCHNINGKNYLDELRVN